MRTPAEPFVIYDLEYTAWPDSAARGWTAPGEHREVVQLAALRVTPSGGFVETDTLDALTRPVLNPVLSTYFVDLTGISNAALARHGHPFAAVLNRFIDFCADAPGGIWSYGPDHLVLAETACIHATRLPDLDFRDTRDAVRAAGHDPSAYTSGTLHRAVAVALDGRPHDALHDCRSQLAFLRRIALAARD